MFDEKIFGQRLKDLRTSQKLTLGQLGREIGVVKQTIGHWETGVRSPNVKTIIKLADYFNVNLDYLTGRTNDPFFKSLQSNKIPTP